MNNVPEPQQCDAIECGTYDNGLWLECDTCHEMHKAQWQQLQQENERLKQLVRDAYNEGFGHGMDDVQRVCPTDDWATSRTNQALKGDE